MQTGTGAEVERNRMRLPSADAILRNALIPAGLLCVWMMAGAWLLPDGVNQVFAARTARYAIPPTLLLGLGFLALVCRDRAWPKLSPVQEDDVSASDMALLLLPLTPVLQYVVINSRVLSLPEAAVVVGTFLLLAAVAILFVPALLRRTGATRQAMYLGLAVAFSIANMATLSKQFTWHEWGSLKIQLPILAGVWLLSWLLFRLRQRRLMHLAIAAFFAGNAAIQLAYRESAPVSPERDHSGNPLLLAVGARQPVRSPSIYLLVYDAYVVSETLAAYGIDNRDQVAVLAGLGFEIYPRTYSVAAHTLSSMGRVLNASMSQYGNERRGVSGDGVVQHLLEGIGYRTYGVFPSDYFLWGVVPRYDATLPARGSSVAPILKGVLSGEFRFDIGFEKLGREQFVAEKQSLLSTLAEGPRFVYAHSSLPGHSTFSGACLPDETELFAERLARANEEMLQDLEVLIEKDPQAIIIIAGDHGPFLTKNCFNTGGVYELSEITRLDIQDRFGTFLAIRWPGADYQAYDEIRVLQDVFPAVFAYLYEDARLLDARVAAASVDSGVISGAQIVDGIIVGGRDDGLPLFLGPPGE